MLLECDVAVRIWQFPIVATRGTTNFTKMMMVMVMMMLVMMMMMMTMMMMMVMMMMMMMSAKLCQPRDVSQAISAK